MSLLECEREHLSVVVVLMVLGLTSAVLANNRIDLLGFLLIFSRVHLISCLVHCERDLPLLGRSVKSPLSSKRFIAFQTVDLAIERVFQIKESYFPARCSAIMAPLLAYIFELTIYFF